MSEAYFNTNKLAGARLAAAHAAAETQEQTILRFFRESRRIFLSPEDALRDNEPHDQGPAGQDGRDARGQLRQAHASVAAADVTGDLVTRLSKAAGSDADGRLMATAAEEIERLRKKLNAIHLRCLNLAHVIKRGCRGSQAIIELRYIAFHAQEAPADPNAPCICFPGRNLYEGRFAFSQLP